MSFKSYITEIEATHVFPSDDKINDVITKADNAFWNVIFESFKNVIENHEYEPGKEFDTFKEQEKIAVKMWLKQNMKQPENLNKYRETIKDLKRGDSAGIVSLQPPATVQPSLADEIY
jgi:hypothetical protein